MQNRKAIFDDVVALKPSWIDRFRIGHFVLDDDLGQLSVVFYVLSFQMYQLNFLNLSLNEMNPDLSE